MNTSQPKQNTLSHFEHRKRSFEASVNGRKHPKHAVGAGSSRCITTSSPLATVGSAFTSTNRSTGNKWWYDRASVGADTCTALVSAPTTTHCHEQRSTRMGMGMTAYQRQSTDRALAGDLTRQAATPGALVPRRNPLVVTSTVPGAFSAAWKPHLHQRHAWSRLVLPRSHTLWWAQHTNQSQGRTHARRQKTSRNTQVSLTPTHRGGWACVCCQQLFEVRLVECDPKRATSFRGDCLGDAQFCRQRYERDSHFLWEAATARA